jgi:hypothetical protein
MVENREGGAFCLGGIRGGVGGGFLDSRFEFCRHGFLLQFRAGFLGDADVEGFSQAEEEGLDEGRHKLSEGRL